MSTTRNATYVLSAQVVLLFSGVIINLGLGRFLGPELYGKYGIIFAVATVMNILLAPGIMQAISKFTAEKKEKASGLAKAMLKKQLALGLALAVAYSLLAIPLTSLLKDKSLLWLLEVLTPMVLIYCITAVYSGYLTGLGRFFEQSTQLTLYSLSRLALTFVLAYFFSITGAIIALPAASLIALIYLAYASRINKQAKNEPTAAVYRFSFHLTAFSALITLFMNTDLLLVQALLNNQQATGFYTAAGTVARIPYFVLTALGTLMLPVVAEKLTSSTQHAQLFVKEAFRYVLILLLPATAILATTAKPLIMLLYRSEYVQAAGPLATLLVGMAALTLAYLLASVLNASGKTVLTVTVAAATLAVSIAANLIAIPKYGLSGAATVVTAASLAAAIILWVGAYRKIGNFVSFKSLLKVAAASLAVLAVAKNFTLQNKFLLPAEYAILGIFYLAILVLLKEISTTDIQRLRSIIRKA